MNKMKIKFFNPNDLENNIKATVHRTGKLGFTLAAAKKFNLKKGSCIRIAIDEDNLLDKNLYAQFYDTCVDGGFKIAKAGEYFYANTKNLFKELRVNHSNETVIYDIELFEQGQPPIYKLKRRK